MTELNRKLLKGTTGSQPSLAIRYDYSHGLLAVVAAWFILMSFSFWWFIAKDARSFYLEQDVLFDKAAFSANVNRISQLSRVKSFVSSNQNTMIHFWNSACPCDRFNSAHFKELLREYSNTDLGFIIVAKGSLTASQAYWQSELRTYSKKLMIMSSNSAELEPLLNMLPASPAAAVVDNNGVLEYFGPYAESGLCQSDKEGLIESVLNGLLSKKKINYPFAVGFGCFCSWN